MTKGARPPGPVFLPVVSHLRASRWPHRSLASPLFARSSLGTMYRDHGAAYGQEGGAGICYDYNRGLGYDGGLAARRGVTTTMSWHRQQSGDGGLRTVKPALTLTTLGYDDQRRIAHSEPQGGGGWVQVLCFLFFIFFVQWKPLLTVSVRRYNN